MTRQKRITLVLLLATLAVAAGSGTASAAIYTAGSFQESPGKVAVRHGVLSAIACTPSGSGCPVFLSGVATGAIGYDSAQVVLTGFMARYNGGAVQPLRTLDVHSQLFNYVPATGNVDLSFNINMGKDSAGTEPLQGEIHFAVIAWNAAQARVTDNGNFCNAAGVGSCTNNPTFTGINPVGMKFGGFGVRRFRIAKSNGTNGVSINHIGLDTSSYIVSGTDVTSKMSCQFDDGTPADDNFDCTAQLIGFAFMGAATDNLTLQKTDTATNGFSLASSDPTPVSIIGGFGALSGFDLRFVSGSWRIWMLAAGFGFISTTLGVADTFNYTRMGMFGTKYNDTSTTQTYQIISWGLEILFL